MDFERNDLLFLSTLTNLRWLAIFGQTVAVLIGNTLIKLQLNITLCVVLILASFFINIVSTLSFPKTKRLSEISIFTLLTFDLLQLASLLYLCGGLTNPFAVLILAPVAVSATILSLRLTILLCSIAILVVSLLSQIHIPLKLFDGAVLVLPDTLMYGIWVALVITITFMSAYSWRVKKDVIRINELLVATKLALEREQKLTALGGLVAAAAHELGSPLTTIKLVSSELLDDFSVKSESKKDTTVEDLELIKSQAERCKEILKNMANGVADDTQIEAVPIIALVKESCSPFQSLGKLITFSLKNFENEEKKINDDQIIIKRSPEIVHGLRNIIQNATDFSQKKVNIDISWSRTKISIAIKDDGPGFSTAVMSGLGEPFISNRKTDASIDIRRPDYESMGLGLFIAKTLLERSGAKLAFRNYSLDPLDQNAIAGAEVVLDWERSDIEETWS